MTSVDGKILGEKWGKDSRVKKLLESFEKTHDSIGVKAWIVGRTTMEKDFTEYAEPVYKETTEALPRTDFVANKDAESFAIAVDGHGKLGWHEPDMLGDHVITILKESVQDSYLAHLREIGVSYIFAGKDALDLPLALEKIHSLFGIETVMLEGGGRLNGSFLNEGLIDEYYQLLLPLADGRIETSSVFEIDESDRRHNASLLKLEEVRQIEDGVVLLRYTVSAQV